MSLKYFLRPYLAPGIEKILLVESGSRHLLEKLIPNLKMVYGETLEVDLVTCYPGVPRGLAPDAKVYRTADFTTPAARSALYGELRANSYHAMGILCSAEPIMTKWKWMLVYRVDAHAFLINENADFIWFDREHSKGLVAYAQTRFGMEGAGAVRILARIVLMPFTLAYLSLFALTVHAQRAWRQFTS